MVCILVSRTASSFRQMVMPTFSREKYENKFHQHDIGEDHEQRGQDHRTSGCTAHARGTSLRTHSLKTGDHPDDQTKRHGLKCGWQEIVEIGAVEALIDELMERKRLSQSLGHPAHQQTT